MPQNRATPNVMFLLGMGMILHVAGMAMLFSHARNAGVYLLGGGGLLILGSGELVLARHRLLPWMTRVAGLTILGLSIWRAFHLR